MALQFYRRVKISTCFGVSMLLNPAISSTSNNSAALRWNLFFGRMALYRASTFAFPVPNVLQRGTYLSIGTLSHLTFFGRFTLFCATLLPLRSFIDTFSLLRLFGGLWAKAAQRNKLQLSSTPLVFASSDDTLTQNRTASLSSASSLWFHPRSGGRFLTWER